MAKKRKTSTKKKAPTKKKMNRYASDFARKGARARWKDVPAEARSEAARKAARARWDRRKDTRD